MANERRNYDFRANDKNLLLLNLKSHVREQWTNINQRCLSGIVIGFTNPKNPAIKT
jgi:hypothetical protein